MSTNFENEDQSLSDWISQAEAARLHGVSRQAIHKLVQNRRIKSTVIGGHTLVSRSDLEAFRPQASGRPKSVESREVDRIHQLLHSSSTETKREILNHLRKEFPIHPLEENLGISAEVILEAIHRSGKLTLRMIRGVIAEAAFDIYVVKNLPDAWQSLPIGGDVSYDFLLKTGVSELKVQVKLQRSKQGRPYLSEEVSRRLGFLPGMFIVETQQTRSGGNSVTGESTRPYRFGEFDILAVALYPSSNKWTTFRYTVADWLIPKQTDNSLLETYQPIPQCENEDWTDDFETCVAWFRSATKKTIQGRHPKP